MVDGVSASARSMAMETRLKAQMDQRKTEKPADRKGALRNGVLQNLDRFVTAVGGRILLAGPEPGRPDPIALFQAGPQFGGDAGDIGRLQDAFMPARNGNRFDPAPGQVGPFEGGTQIRQR